MSRQSRPGKGLSRRVVSAKDLRPFWSDWLLLNAAKDLKMRQEIERHALTHEGLSEREIGFMSSMRREAEINCKSRAGFFCLESVD
jgi:hypothetical protein